MRADELTNYEKNVILTMKSITNQKLFTKLGVFKRRTGKNRNFIWERLKPFIRWPCL